MASKKLILETIGPAGRNFATELATAKAKLEERKATSSPGFTDFIGHTIKVRTRTRASGQLNRQFWAHLPQAAAPGTGKSHAARARAKHPALVIDKMAAHVVVKAGKR